jgi:hypothetical protein
MNGDQRKESHCEVMVSSLTRKIVSLMPLRLSPGGATGERRGPEVAVFANVLYSFEILVF